MEFLWRARAGLQCAGIALLAGRFAAGEIAQERPFELPSVKFFNGGVRVVFGVCSLKVHTFSWVSVSSSPKHVGRRHFLSHFLYECDDVIVTPKGPKMLTEFAFD